MHSWPVVLLQAAIGQQYQHLLARCLGVCRVASCQPAVLAPACDESCELACNGELSIQDTILPGKLWACKACESGSKCMC